MQTEPGGVLALQVTDAAIYERISGIRAELLEVIGKVGSSNRSLELDATVMEDDLIMVANRLGQVAVQLRPTAGPADGPLGTSPTA